MFCLVVLEVPLFHTSQNKYDQVCLIFRIKI